MVWHPAKYAEMFADKLRTHHADVWLVNTGWSGGAYGTGKRMKLAYTRAIIDAIHSGELANAPTTRDPVFGLHMVTACPGVPCDILVPRETWADKTAYDATAKKLAGLFRKNFEPYAANAGPHVAAAGPRG
jgi:phosphoenolpyruvate carboxykinase (ATP)